MKKFFALLLSAVLVLSLAACGKNEGTVNVSGEGDISTSYKAEEDERILSFTASDIYGNKVSSDIFKDSKITVVNIWGTFCSPCIYEMPFLGELSRAYDKSEVQFLGIVSDAVDYFGAKDENAVALADELVKETKADYTHIVPSMEVLEFLYDVTAVPTTFFLDSEGRVIGEAVVGAREKDAWKEIIDNLLEEAK